MLQMKIHKNLFPVTVKNMNEVIAEIIFDVGELDAEMSKEFEEVVNDDSG